MPSGTVCIVWGDSQFGSLTHAHLGNPFFPASDHLLLAQHKLKGLVSCLLAQHKLKGLVSVPRGIEFLSILKHPGVAHHAGLAVLGEGVPVSGEDRLPPPLPWRRRQRTLGGATCGVDREWAWRRRRPSTLSHCATAPHARAAACPT